MKNEYHNLIVEKSSDVEIGQFNDSDEYIITHKLLGNRIIVNQKTIDLINLVDGKTTLQNIVLKFNNKYPLSKVSIDTAYKLLYEKLGKQGTIINKNLELKKNEIASYLSLSFTLTNKKVLNHFIKIIEPLFCFRFFYGILAFSLSAVLIIVILNFSKLIRSLDSISPSLWAIYVLVGGGILFLHELGHATACKKLGAEPGSIGFGFYMLSPVMFADVSEIWKLKRKERLYVNFAGLYIEILIALVLAIIYLFTEEISLIILCSMVLLSFLLNLNPLLRYDGYWILSDLTNTPNLRKVSIQKLNLFISSIFRKSKTDFSTKDLFLIVYSIVSLVFIFMFLAFIFVRDPNSLFSFPKNIFSYGKEIVNDGKSIVLSDLTQFILPFLFYYVVIKFIIVSIIKYAWQQKI